MKIKCIKTWYGEGDYLWGGQAAYIKGEETNIISSHENEEGITYIIEDKKYSSYDVLYSHQEPYFSEYFEVI